jgi:hypothetical protein
MHIRDDHVILHMAAFNGDNRRNRHNRAFEHVHHGKFWRVFAQVGDDKQVAFVSVIRYKERDDLPGNLWKPLA